MGIDILLAETWTSFMLNGGNFIIIPLVLSALHLIKTCPSDLRHQSYPFSPMQKSKNISYNRGSQTMGCYLCFWDSEMFS